jgi:hypothetical protein
VFVDHPIFTAALRVVRFSNECSLRRLRPAAQLNEGNRPAFEVVTERYEGLWRSPLKADPFRNGSFSTESAGFAAS